MSMETHIEKPVRHGDEIEIEITALAFGGDSVGRFQDFAIFVPGGIPGERVKIKVMQVKDQYATGKLLSVLRLSADRTAPPCPIFEECGGCQWQHIAYPKQLQTKRQFVVDALKRIGKLPNVAVQPCLPSAEPYGYRNKAMPVLSMRDGRFISGIYEPQSHKLVPYHSCPIQADAVNKVIQQVLEKIDRSGLTPYQEKKHEGFLRHLTVRVGMKTGEILLAFVTRTEMPEERLHKPSLLPEDLGQILPHIARELMAEVPGLVGVLQNINPSRTNVVFGVSTRTLAGRDYYNEIIDNLKLKVSLKSFLQVNTQQADILHEVVREALGEPKHQKKWGTVLDLYSGVGTLALAVADKADYVVGMEEIGAAVEDAKANIEANRKQNIDFLEGDVDLMLGGLKEKGMTHIDAAILDPPRKGVLPENLTRLVAFQPERIVYVSCDPSTLARDLELLVKQGYQVEWAQPLDMFPQTYHVETVVKLTRQTPGKAETVSQPGREQPEPFRLSKPPENPSMNISASFSMFKEKTTALYNMVFQTFKAGLALIGAFSTTFFKGSVQGVRFCGRAIGRFFWETGKIFGRGFKQIGSFLRLLGLGSWKTIQNILGMPLLVFGRLRVFSRSKPKISIVLPPQEPSLSQAEKPETFPATENAVPETVFMETLTEVEMPIGVEKELPPPVPPGKAPPGPGTFWERKTPTFEKITGALLKLFSSRRVLRWALVLAFFVGGAFVAKATFSPTPKKSSRPVPTLSEVMPDVMAVMPTRNFLRYEMVPFEVRVNPSLMPGFSNMKASACVYHGGEPVSMVDGHIKLFLKKDRNHGRFLGNWPIPYNPEPGTYVAEVEVTSPDWVAPKTFPSAFTISPLKPRGLFPGYTALTMEGGKQLVQGTVPALDGSESMRSSNAIEWARFMGANVYCYLIGQTSIWDRFKAQDFPFNRSDMEVGRRYAQAAHAAGLKFAGYITAFKVIGDAWSQAPYQFSLGYEAEKDQVIQTRFISLLDPKRRQDLIDMLKKLNEDSLIDMIGLDYVRTGPAGYEMVEEFVKDMNVPGPPDFWSISREERIHWLARTVELKENKQVIFLYEWWRAHRVALILKDILEEAKVTKPVFTFTLGWQMGHQHGQDPAMYVDAGVNYNHIMLYEGDRGIVDSMKKQWPAYLSRCNGMYAMGEMVDFNWVQKTIDPPGPEELYNRQVETFQKWFPVNAGVGMFWHDLYRLLYGFKGPYSIMEWTIAGGKAFTTLHQAQGLSPLEVTLLAPKQIPAGVRVPITVEIYNRSDRDEKGIMLHQLDTSKSYYSDLTTLGPFELPSGSRVKVKSLFVQIPKEDHPERDNQYMAAVMVEKQGDLMRVFDFKYLKKISPGMKVPQTNESEKIDAPQDGKPKPENQEPEGEDR
jgi:23S rRNA (uracil1939-C5)-methyltransferase